jgi:hypothetical protein
LSSSSLSVTTHLSTISCNLYSDSVLSKAINFLPLSVQLTAKNIQITLNNQ